METVGIGVIGCGAMGLSLVQMILNNNSRLKLVALYDPDQRSIDRARSVDECISIHRAWQQSGTTFIIGFALHYSPHYQKMKELISKEHFGKIISMEFNEMWISIMVVILWSTGAGCARMQEAISLRNAATISTLVYFLHNH